MATITVKRPFVLSLPVTTTQKRLLLKDGQPVLDANGQPSYVEEVVAVSAKETWFRQVGTVVVDDSIANNAYVKAGADGAVALPGEVPVQIVAPPPPATPAEARKRAEELLALADQLEQQSAPAAVAGDPDVSQELVAALNTPISQLPKVDGATATAAAADASVATATVQAPQVPLPSGQLPPGKQSAGAAKPGARK